MSSLLLPDAKTLLRQGDDQQKMLKQFGVLWDDSLNPHCPADKTLLHLSGRVVAEGSRLLMTYCSALGAAPKFRFMAIRDIKSYSMKRILFGILSTGESSSAK